MSSILLSPPIAFLIFLLVSIGFTRILSAFSAHGEESERKLESYACGQRQVEHAVSPDYSQFFPYAFFFTIMHVLVLVVATAPAGSLLLPLLYVGGGILALVIIFRR